eukprot:scaffold265648_cov26-Tisochrysis_lutea.AAC.1
MDCGGGGACESLYNSTSLEEWHTRGGGDGEETVIVETGKSEYPKLRDVRCPMCHPPGVGIE